MDKEDKCFQTQRNQTNVMVTKFLFSRKPNTVFITINLQRCLGNIEMSKQYSERQN